MSLCVLIFFLSALRSSSPPVKLYKHRVDVTEGSGTSYGEFPADIAMSYKPIAPAPTGSNHTPPGFNSTFLMSDVQTSAYSCLHCSHQIWFWSTIKLLYRISGWLYNIRPQVTITTIQKQHSLTRVNVWHCGHWLIVCLWHWGVEALWVFFTVKIQNKSKDFGSSHVYQGTFSELLYVPYWLRRLPLFVWYV